MILVSCRKDFSDSRAFADANAIRHYEFPPRRDRFLELDEDNLANDLTIASDSQDKLGAYASSGGQTSHD